MRKVFLLLLIILISVNGFTQSAASYSFSAFSGTYSSISSTGTAIPGILCDDCTQTGIPIGFTFNYCGTNYTQLAVCSNGFISLANSSGANYVVGTSYLSGGGVGVLMPNWVDLYGFSGSSSAYYQTSGTMPNRTFTVEWKNWGVYGWPGASGTTNMQVILYETSNVIDFVYGSSTLSGMGYVGDAVGIANSTTDYQTLNNVSSSPTPSSGTFYTTAITSAPALNQVYRWANQCSGTPVTGSVSATVDSGCTSFTSVLSLPTSSIGAGLSYQWQSSPDGITWTNISGATGATYTATVTTTTWYRCVITCSYSGLSGTSPGIELFVHHPPGAITGATTLCSGSSSTLADTSLGGTWSSAATSVATIGSSSGVVTAGSPGTSVITYTLPTGCSITTTVTVVTAPGVIGGPSSVCTGATIPLSDPTGGGTWVSSAPAIASVGATTGVVTGVSSGVATITYGIGTCIATKTITVNSSPAVITGPSSVCVGYTIILSDATSGGTWSCSSASATVGSLTGVVTGISAGPAVITYTLPGGCYSVHTVAVNAIPGGITGIPYVCIGQTTVLFDAGGGTWTSANPAIATAGATTGIVTGVSAGTVIITYTLPTGCYTTTPVVVAPLPGAITGNLNVCVGSNDTLSDTSLGGVWSCSPSSVAYIDIFSGVVAGLGAGTATVTYTLAGGTGCSITTTVSVNPPPGAVIGTPSVCVGATTTLGGAGGGTWSSSNTAVATIGSGSGLLSGISPGLSIISYTLPTGCSASMVVTVNPQPSAITGTMTVCVGLTTALSGPFGGTWSSGTPTVGAISPLGVVTGVSAGTTVITYTLPTGCYTTATVTVNSSPAPITGTAQVCMGGTTIVSNATPGGTWAISPTTTATISSGGTVTGITAGLAIVTYSIGAGCATTAVITVNALPASISGPSAVCVGATITLTSSPGVTWSSSSTAIATVGASTGIVTGTGAGVVNIIATNPLTGCTRSKPVNVNAPPVPIAGFSTVCAGSTILVSDVTGGGTWNVSPTTVATVGATTGIVTGVAAGTALLSYTLTSTGCAATRSVTVYALPPACTVTGGGAYCTGGIGVHVNLSCSVSGNNYQLYFSGTPVGAPLSGTGLALDFGLQTTAGTYTVVATNSVTGCSATMSGSATVTVNPAPLPIGGPSALCVGATVTLSSSPTGGGWGGSTPSVATVGSGSGVVTGVHTGTTTITYTLPTGCYVTKAMTVSLSPGPIGGPGFACTGTTITTLIDTVPGGLWSSGTPAVASIGSLSGVVTGGSTTGTTVITYSLGSGCTVTKTLTVYVSPAAISGTLALCQGATTTLSDASAGGVWSSSLTSVAAISPATGLLTAVAPGTATIAYTVPSGCSATAIVTVNPLPGLITGTPHVCVGGFTSLSDIIPGGAWSSGSTSVATIAPATGMLSGLTPGTALITYTLSTGCLATRIITVNPGPAAVTGTPHVCVGLTTTLADATPGGVWSHTTPSVAGLAGSAETGLSAGVDTVSYTIPLTGCAARQAVTVNPVPTAITGPSGVCVGQTIALSDAIPGGTWSSGNPAIATVDAVTGVVTGVAFGAAPVTYSLGGCSVTGVVNVISSPLAISGPSVVCVGQTITLTDPSAGGAWSSGIPTEATVGGTTGIVTGISSGTVIISYTLGTGCTAVKAVVVNPIAPVLGTPTVCVGQTVTLTDTALGGTWTSSALPVATVAAYSGVVTGVTPGTSVITYTLGTGCSTNITVTVNSTPPPVSGPATVCVGQAILETDPASSGVWTSGNPAVATISTGGLVTGISAGAVTISYTLPGIGCPATRSVTVNTLPAAITGSNQLCSGGAIVLHDITPGGTWSSSVPSVAAVGPITGVVSGLTTGITNISYTLGTGCAAQVAVTVNAAVPALTGPLSYCLGASVALSSSVPGGTWGSSAPLVVSVALACIGVGYATITYNVSAGCAASAVVTVNNLPAAIAGSTSVCQGGTTSLSDATGGGAWSSSDTTVAAIGPVTGLVTGIAPGSVTITYATSVSGCTVTAPMAVNAAPSAITGTFAVCTGVTTLLSDITPGGAWSSSNPAVATISSAGLVTGITAGTTTISYTVAATGCVATQVVSVNTMPGSVTGLTNICPGATTTLAAMPAGGAWTSTTPATATITTGGLVTGLSSGATVPVLATFYYSLGAGCGVSASIYVNPAPDAVTGPGNVCVSQAVTLADVTPGGAWSSALPAIGTVDAGGDVTGISAGVTTISYSNSYGCAATWPVTVNPMPGAIVGSANVCLGGTSALSDATTGGTWLSSFPSVATVSSAGVVTGVSLGTTTIIYELPPSGSCFVTKVLHVYPLPAAYLVTGGGSHCSGDTGVHIGLNNSALGVNYMLYRGAAAVGAFAGTGLALDFGLQTVPGVYTVIGTSAVTGCSTTMTGSATIGVVTSVVPSIAIGIAPGDTVCAGTTVNFTSATANGGSAPAYQWSINGHPVALTTGYTYIPADGDSVKVSLTSNATCAIPSVVSSTVAMHVRPFVTPAVNLVAVPGDTVCAGTAVSVHAVTEYGGTNPSFTWVKNGVPVAVAGASDTYSWTPADGDVIYCALYSNYACRLANSDTSSALAITVDAPVLPVAAISANPGTSVSLGQSDTLTAVVTNAIAPSYQWYVNGIPVPGSTTNTFVSSSFSAGTKPDSVSCAVTSNGVCQSTSHQWVYISVHGVGVHQISSAGEINVIPNPNKGEFMIKGSLGSVYDEDVTIEMTDMLGQQVYKNVVVAKGGRMDQKIALAGVANGMYMLTLHSGAGSMVFHVVIEQ